MQRKNSFLPSFLVFFVLSLLLLLLGRVGFLKSFSFFVPGLTNGIRLSIASAVTNDSNEAKLSNVPSILDQKKMEADIKALRDQFAISRPSSTTLLPAKVIGLPSFIPGATPPEFLILDKGWRDGVKKDQAVVLLQNLVGKVSQVSQNSSKAILITNKDILFAAKLESEALGVVRGLGDSLIIDNILLSEEVKKDSLILTKGSEDLSGVGLPPDLIVGKIASIEKKSSDLFQKARVQTLVDLTKINMVFIVIK